jgi:hypothetical protein
MDAEQLPLASDLLTTMRVAVDYAQANGTPFVTAHHILLALLDDRFVGPSLNDALKRPDVELAAKEARPSHVAEIKEAFDAPADISTLKRYDTLAFRSVDGTETLWLDRTAYHVFLEGARRVERGAFGPKHLALGLLTEAIRNKELRQVLGSDPGSVSATVYAL